MNLTSIILAGRTPNAVTRPKYQQLFDEILKAWRQQNGYGRGKPTQAQADKAVAYAKRLRKYMGVFKTKDGEFKTVDQDKLDRFMAYVNAYDQVPDIEELDDAELEAGAPSLADDEDDDDLGPETDFSDHDESDDDEDDEPAPVKPAAKPVVTPTAKPAAKPAQNVIDDEDEEDDDIAPPKGKESVPGDDEADDEEDDVIEEEEDDTLEIDEDLAEGRPIPVLKPVGVEDDTDGAEEQEDEEVQQNTQLTVMPPRPKAEKLHRPAKHIPTVEETLRNLKSDAKAPIKLKPIDARKFETEKETKGYVKKISTIFQLADDSYKILRAYITNSAPVIATGSPTPTLPWDANRILGWLPRDYDPQIAISDKSYTTRVRGPDVEVQIGSLGTVENVIDIEAALQKIMPGFKMPKSYKFRVPHAERNIFGPHLIETEMPPVKTTVNIKKLMPALRQSGVKLERVHEDLVKAFNELKSYKEYNDAFPKSPLVFEINFDPERVYLKGKIVKDYEGAEVPWLRRKKAEESQQGETGTAISTALIEAAEDSVYFVIPIQITVLLRWPHNFVSYATCSSRWTNIVPSIFGQYLAEHKRAFFNSKPGKPAKGPRRISNFQEILEAIGKERSRYQPRVYKDLSGDPLGDDFIVLGTGEEARVGRPMWCPEENNLAEYFDILQGAYDPDTQTVKHVDLKPLHDKPIFTDWQNEKFTYVNTNGTLVTRDLSGSRPINLMTICEYVEEVVEYKNRGKDIADALDTFLRGANKDFAAYVEEAGNFLASKGLDIDHMDIERIKRTGSSLTRVFNTLDDTSIEGSAKIRYYHIGGVPLPNAKRFSTPFHYAQTMILVAALNLVFRDLAADFDKANNAYSVKLELLRFQTACVLVFPKYMIKDNEFTKKSLPQIREQMKELNNGEALNQDIKVKFFNMPGLTQVAPHQLRYNKQTHPIVIEGQTVAPNAVLVSAQVGAGKTGPISMSEILRYIGMGLVKRPLVIMPGGLIKSWINEEQNMCKGQVNLYPITLNTIRQFQKQILKAKDNELNLDMLKHIMLQMPTNTIFVTSYTTLARYVRRIVYGDQIVDRFPLAEFLRDEIKIDLVAVDEGHRLKNTSSSQTQAVSVIVAGANYYRDLSGTIVDNTVTDITGQMAVYNPAVFGSNTDFKNKYASNPSVASSSIKTGMMGQLKSRLSVYAMSYSAVKGEWAHMLPKLAFNFHFVRMTENQQEYYDTLLEESYEKLIENPRVKEILENGTEEERNQINRELDAFFQKLEYFVSNPGDELAFKESLGDNIKKEDILPASLTKVVEICRKHAQTYFTPEIINKRQKEVAQAKKNQTRNKLSPMQNKVMIVTFRKNSPVTIFENLPPDIKKHAMLYTAATSTEVMEAFYNNDDLWYLVGTENTLREGHNLQHFSRIIRVESQYTPGAMEQSRGRIERPDMKNINTGKQIFIDYILTDKSVMITKFARLSIKYRGKMMYDHYSNPRFKTLLDRFESAGEDEIQHIKLNLEGIKQFSDAKICKPFFDEYLELHNWEQSEFDLVRKKGVTNIIIADEDRETIEGSAPAKYIPRIPGALPYSREGYKLTPVSVLESELAREEQDYDESPDEEDEDSDAGYVSMNLEVGQILDTEYGIGIIKDAKDIKKNTVTVQIPGFGFVTVPKATCFAFTDIEEENKVIEELNIAIKTKNPGKFLRLPNMDVQDMAKKQEQKEILEKPSVIEDDAEEEGINLNLVLIDGALALIHDGYDEAFAADFHQMPHAYELEAENYQRLATLNGSLTLMNSRGIQMRDEPVDTLGMLMPYLKRSKPVYDALMTRQYALSFVKGFNKAKLASNTAHTYLIVPVGAEPPKVIFRVTNSPASAAIRKQAIPNMKWHIEDNSLMCAIGGPNALKALVTKYSKHVNVLNKDALIETLNGLKAVDLSGDE